MNRSKLFKILLGIGLLVVLIFVVLWQMLPGFLESRVLPGLAAQNNIGWQNGRIRRIGLTGFDAGQLMIGSDEKGTGISVGALHVDYTPMGLLRSQISGITINGLTLNVEAGGQGRVE